MKNGKCGCHDKIDPKVPIEPSKTRDKKLFPKKDNPFMGDYY